MHLSAATLAGLASTTLFAASVLPMLWRAARTGDVSSYSLGHLVLVNAGNVVHSVYVASLPAGPVWLLHGLHVTSSVVMLGWKLRHRPRDGCGVGGAAAES